MDQIKQPFKKIFLIILDGFGLASADPGNAETLAGMPYLNSLISNYPSMSIVASSLAVGMPWGQYGNSEVGHSAIGTGRIIIQDLALINGEIRSDKFFQNPAFLQALDHCVKNDSNLHLLGCVSPGGIHSHENHLYALLEFARRNNYKKVFVHMITDGQDTGPQDAVQSLARLKPYLEKSGAKIASVQGRTYAMDRVLNWPLTQQVWDAAVRGTAPQITGVKEYLEQSYQKGIFDHDIVPATVAKDGKPVAAIGDNDAVIFFNFRNDRMRQLIMPFVSKDFDGFDRGAKQQNLMVATMTPYADGLPVTVAYEAPIISNTLGDVISKKRLAQYRIAEKEKEAHVTNFFNGGWIRPLPGEERMIASSRQMKGKEYIEHPEMSAKKITDVVLERADDDKTLYVINYANADMIGHSGNIEAAIIALKLLDSLLEKLVEALVADPNKAVIVTADHGNAEEMIDPLTGEEDTQHSTRNVPLIFAAKPFSGKGVGKTLEVLADENPIGSLVDIAPSALYLLGIEQPAEMTGSTLITDQK